MGFAFALEDWPSTSAAARRRHSELRTRDVGSDASTGATRERRIGAAIAHGEGEVVNELCVAVPVAQALLREHLSLR